MLCGGLRAGTVYDVYGGAGTGKTQLCLQLAASAVRGTSGKQSRRHGRGRIRISILRFFSKKVDIIFLRMK